jgi:nucleoid-associated protein YgaU
MPRAVLPHQPQNPRLALELLAVASLVQQWQEVCLDAVLLSLLLIKNHEDPSLLVEEEEAKSLEGKDQGERSVNFTDPTGLYDWATGNIESGDTLSQIVAAGNKAAGTNLAVSDWAKLNGITDPNKIQAGQWLAQPDKVFEKTHTNDFVFPDVSAVSGIPRTDLLSLTSQALEKATSDPTTKKVLGVSAGVIQMAAGVAEVSGSVGMFAAMEAGTAGAATPIDAPLAFAGVNAGVLTTTLGFANTMQALSGGPTVSPASSLYSGIATAAGADSTTASWIGFAAGTASAGYGTFGLPGNKLLSGTSFVLGTARDGLPVASSVKNK